MRSKGGKTQDHGPPGQTHLVEEHVTGEHTTVDRAEAVPSPGPSCTG